VVRLFPDGRRQTLYSDSRITRLGGITAARDGRIFASATVEGAGAVLEIDAAGVLVTAHAIPGSADRAIDLGADQCTLFIGRSPGIARYDVCTRQALETIASGYVHDVRALPQGDVLVATSTESVLYRYDSSGALVRTYEFPTGDAPAAIALEDENTAVVATDNGASGGFGGRVFRLNLLSGEFTHPEDEYYSALVQSPRSFVLYDGFTAALGATSRAPSDVPSLTDLSLALLTLFLAAVAARRMA
jgi:hypothetical protein